ncbi:MAG: cytochrome P450 [Acuticoccus sp.]
MTGPAASLHDAARHGITATHGPPEWSPAQGAWVVSRYADAAAVLRHPDLAVADVAAGVRHIGRRAGRSYTSLTRLLGGILFFRNPPFQPIARRFLRQSMAAMAPRLAPEAVAPIVARVLDEAAGDDPVDAMARIGKRLPVLVMADALGLAEGSAAVMHDRGAGLLAAAERGLPLRVLGTLDQQAATLEEMLRGAIDAGGAPDSGIAQMRAINRAEFGFDDEAFLGCVFFLLMAGIETTSALLGSALLFTRLYPDERRRLAETPERIAPFIDEVLRVASPVRRMNGRLAEAPLEIGGNTIAAGVPIVVDIERAHHDPAAHAGPARFVVGRRGPPALAFGVGGRACLGASLARLETRLLLQQLSAYDIAHGEGRPDWEDNPRLRRLSSLHLHLRHKTSRSDR